MHSDAAPHPVEDSYPRQAARTRSFRLGSPRSFTVSPDGTRVVLLRSATGTDPVNALHVIEVGTGHERLVVDPRLLLAGADEDLPEAERARRERMRETTSGITAYTTDADVTRAAFALSGNLYVVSLVDGAPARELDAPGPVVDPRLSPDGRSVAYVAEGALHIVDWDGGGQRTLLAPESATVTYGLADFIAAEELDRSRGLWWSPASDALLVERVDEAAVPTWWISDPAHPEQAPVAHRYPAAGADNPAVSLLLVSVDAPADKTGARTSPVREIAWDHRAFEYLVSVSWQSGHDPLVSVLSRDQRRLLTLAVDLQAATARTVLEITDEHWIEVVTGQPGWSPDGRLVHTVDDADTRRLAFDGSPITPAGLQVRSVVGIDDDGVVVSATHEPTASRLVRVGWDGTLADLTPADGWNAGVVAGEIMVRSRSTLDGVAADMSIVRAGHAPVPIASVAERPSVRPLPRLLRAGARELRTALLLPHDHVPGSRRLPVLMSPYGGPGHQSVIEAGQAFTEDQWLADQGFAVVVADGRGTPARGPAWERAIAGDVATAALADQVDALDAVAQEYPDDIDLSRVGIRGWSFGGYLSALAVLRRPDRFHAAVAGAPVTDWRRYDTAYTERYLGHPGTAAAAYDASSLLDEAATLSRPLMIIHGLADDNVVVAHSLALSGRLLAAGRPHTMLPLTGVTHMTPQEDVAENLLLLQVDFLRTHLQV